MGTVCCLKKQPSSWILPLPGIEAGPGRTSGGVPVMLPDGQTKLGEPTAWTHLT